MRAGRGGKMNRWDRTVLAWSYVLVRKRTEVGRTVESETHEDTQQCGLVKCTFFSWKYTVGHFVSTLPITIASLEIRERSMSRIGKGRRLAVVLKNTTQLDFGPSSAMMRKASGS
jgi:hypothetical protein